MSLDEPGELRRVSDPRALRALAHPVRMALLEELAVGGPMTATQVGERIAESPTTCSFHLRQLAKYGFVEEAGGGKGRARPWRLTTVAMQITGDDAESGFAADAVHRMFAERVDSRYRKWLETKANYPQDWQRVAEHSQYVFYLTVDELRQLNEELTAVLMPAYQKFQDRMTDATVRPPGSALVELLLRAYPTDLPTAPRTGATDDA
jgi:DNA-binding transcriptional ArsR family regulator